MVYPPIPDMANYTPNFTLTEALSWRDNLGIKKVYIQAVDPPPGYPAGKTRQQIEVALTVGFKIGIYYYNWYENGNWLERDIALIQGYEDEIDDHLIDIEDIETGRNWSAQQRADSINFTNDRLAQLPSKVGKVRKYSGKWYTDQYLPGIDYSGDDWVVSQYDGIRDTNVITGWFGLGKVVAKQYAGTSVLGGTKNLNIRQLSSAENDDLTNGRGLAFRQSRKGHVRWGTVSGIDLSVPSDEEYSRIMDEQPTDPCEEIQNEANGLVNSLGWLGKDAMTQTGVVKSTNKSVKKYLDMVRVQCDAHGIQHA